MTSEKRLSKTTEDPLVQRCFVIFGKDYVWSRQGFVKANLGEGYYLVRFFDALMGEPSTSAIFHISDMTDRNRERGGWEFFENDEHLREWIESRS